MIIVMANFLVKNKQKLNFFIFILYSLGIISLPIIFIALQPDLGTAIIFIPISLTMLFIIGINMFYLICFLIVCFISVAIPIITVYNNVVITSNNFLLLFSDLNFIISTIVINIIVGIIIFLFNYFFFKKRSS